MIRNLTPHAVNINNITIHPSGIVARVEKVTNLAGKFEGIPLVKGSYGEVIDLPEEKEGVMLIVSSLVRIAMSGRSDLASPADLVRDVDGRIIGCESLEIN